MKRADGSSWRSENVLSAALLVLAMLTALHASAASVTVHVTDRSGQSLPEAAVYALPVSGKAPLKATAAAIIDQIKREFVPLVSVMQTGTMVTFPNKDNIRHHVYSFSPAKTFELRLYSGTQAPPVAFDKPGLIKIGCNIHDHMIAYALVVDSAWFGKTDAAGKAMLDGLPNGEYEIHVWHHRQTAENVPPQRLSAKGNVSSEITVRVDANVGK